MTKVSYTYKHVHLMLGGSEFVYYWSEYCKHRQLTDLCKCSYHNFLYDGCNSILFYTSSIFLISFASPKQTSMRNCIAHTLMIERR